MNNFELSQEAQEAMRGDFILAGENGTLPATAADIGGIAAPDTSTALTLPGDFTEATNFYLNTHPDRQAQIDYGQSYDNLAVEDQLNHNFQFTALIMGAMGLHAPHSNLTSRQQSNLEQTFSNLKANPQAYSDDPNAHWRLVASPVFPSDNNLLENRQQMLRSVRDDINTPLNATEEPLWTPKRYTGIDYDLLMTEPDSPSDDFGSSTILSVGLRYNVPAEPGKPSEAVSRSEYLSHLYDQGLVVPGSGNILWTYNFVDVRHTTPRSPNKNVQTLFENLSATSTLEQEIVVQALLVITDQQNSCWDSNIHNEAVYQLGGRDSPQFLRSAIGVDRGPHNRGINLDDWHTGIHPQFNRLGSRPSVSGL